jgi:hypothetical protein
MSNVIIRTKTKASGGITEREKVLMDEHARLWISRAMRTNPIEPEKIMPAIKSLYAAAGLKKPRVIIVPSPLVMAFAIVAAAQQIRELLCGPIQHDEHMRGWRWHVYVQDDKKRWDSVKSEFRKMHPNSRTLEEILEAAE